MLEELNMSHVTLLGESSRKLVRGFLLTLPHVPFPFADFTLYLFTDVEVLSFVSPFSKLRNLRVVLGSPEIVPLTDFEKSFAEQILPMKYLLG